MTITKTMLAICLLAACSVDGAAQAQDNPANSPASSGGATACRDFTLMDTGTQTDLVKRLAGSDDADVSNTDADTANGSGARATSGDYSLNSVTAACHNFPDMTVGQAIAKGSGGTSEGTTGTAAKSGH